MDPETHKRNTQIFTHLQRALLSELEGLLRLRDAADIGQVVQDAHGVSGVPHQLYVEAMNRVARLRRRFWCIPVLGQGWNRRSGLKQKARRGLYSACTLPARERSVQKVHLAYRWLILHTYVVQYYSKAIKFVWSGWAPAFLSIIIPCRCVRRTLRPLRSRD
jgi:hypothetical protein